MTPAEGYTIWSIDHQAAIDSRIRRRIFVRRKSDEKNSASRIHRKSAEKNTDIRIIKWNQHYRKWLACYLKWIILVISKLLVITDGRRFCNSKTNGQSFQFRFNNSAEIVCNQPNFNRKIIVFSRIVAEFFLVYAIIRLIRISADPSSQPSIFYSDCRLAAYRWVYMSFVLSSPHLRR